MKVVTKVIIILNLKLLGIKLMKLTKSYLKQLIKECMNEAIQTIETGGKYTLKGTKYSVNVDPKLVSFNRIFHKDFKIEPQECPHCHKTEYVFYKKVSRGEELVIHFYKCLNCGYKDTEPLD